MATESKKCVVFTREPMDEKHVKKVPGIGKKISLKLVARDITRAVHLYDYYRAHTEKEFKRLIDDCGGNELYQDMAYNALEEWHQQFGNDSD